MKQPLDKFTLAYIECALWSSTDNADDSGGDPLEENYSIEDFAPETLEKMVKDCNDFRNQNIESLAQSTLDADYAGHDFWLSRNGHGAGFWDRYSQHGDDYDKYLACDNLHSSAKTYGEFNLYIGDDGKIYA